MSSVERAHPARERDVEPFRLGRDAEILDRCAEGREESGVELGNAAATVDRSDLRDALDDAGLADTDIDVTVASGTSEDLPAIASDYSVCLRPRSRPMRVRRRCGAAPA